ncbi:putative Endonuclease-reverse transcriptase/Reverse transcriptase (RNA-dependent DNA polymerase) [Trypanosoma cruzi]|uniref:Putative Endonuclease-reverse transcriptase/Reverse transcriptase (RNA-dependent DNA polymerase) n=1 Tax=Trypanosoma cruzi TaxID=5693 RepID=A0A2V2X611_TRYCR|nr:putative Endonuclease-reverse transcriptase/Reverse transcriptase (RNA-dependent DNA polymerase) [Trypanosoma cruzi]
MALVPYTATEWSHIGARLSEWVRQHGAIEVQLTFLDEDEPSDATLTVANSTTGLRLVSGNIAKPWEDSSLAGHVANLRAPQVPRFEAQVILPIIGATRGLRAKQGLTIAERERLSADYAHAVANTQNPNARLHSRVGGSHNSLSARESNIAVADGLLAERECALAGSEQQVEATRARTQEREYQLRAANAQLHEREARVYAREAQQAARVAETAGQDEAPATRRGPTDGPVRRQNTAEDGVTTQPHQTNILMAGGVPSRAAGISLAGERRQAIPRTSQGNFGRPHFHPSMPLPPRNFSLDAHSGSPTEEERKFLPFDVATWPPRVWNKGISGVVFDLQCAYQCWHQDEEQVKLAFDNLVEWIGVLEGWRDPTDRFMNLGRSLLNTFRMQLTIASDPGTPLSTLRARLHTAVNKADTFARGTQPLVGRQVTQRSVRRPLCHTYRHDASTCNARGAARKNHSLAQPASSTWCQGRVLFAREEAKRLLPIRCTRRGRRRRTNGLEGHQMEPFTWLPAERCFYPLLNSIGAYQRYTYCLRAVCDAQRQKLLLSGDIEQNPGPIAVLQMNVSCLTPSKLATLMAQGADIIAIQETWKSSQQIASMHAGDYVLYAQSRIGKGGGVAVLVRKTLRSKRIPLTIPQHDTSLEVVVAQVALDQNRDLIVASAYMRPPPQVTQSFRRLVNCLPASSPLLLCGDFKMHHPQWEPFLESSPSEVAADFLELCTDAGLTLVNTPGEIAYARGTRERSCIDLTWSKHLTVSIWSASVSPLSDHYMLTFTLHQAFKDTIPSAPMIFYSWGKCKWDLFVKDFDAQLPVYDYKKRSTGIKAFTRALITSYRRHCPRGMHKDGPRLWDDTLMEAERIATDSKARYLQLPTPDREAEMQRTRSQFFLLLRERLRNTYLRRISKLNPGEPLAWKYISGRKKASLPSPTSLLLGDGQHTYKTARRAANALNRIFFPRHPSHKAVRFSKGIKRQNTSLGITSSSLFRKQNNNESAATSNSVFSFSSNSEPQDNSEAATTSGLVAHLHSPLDAPFNRTELLAALRKTPYGKAPGPDKAYSEALRHISSKGLRFLLRCINHSWTTGTIPAEWRRATIVPLLKPGKSPELLESYRPISLTSIVSKVAEKMVLKRLLWVWTPHPHQYAYRSVRTTTMQLAHLRHEVEHNRNHYFQVNLPKKSGIGNQLHYRPHRTLLALVDFSKAFDSIDHRVLSRLLANIPGVNCRRWLRNFLCGRYAKTRVGNRNSDRRPILRGVPQGPYWEHICSPFTYTHFSIC